MTIGKYYTKYKVVPQYSVDTTDLKGWEIVQIVPVTSYSESISNQPVLDANGKYTQQPIVTRASSSMLQFVFGMTESAQLLFEKKP